MASGIKVFVEALRREFYSRIDRKTGWGKVELREEFEQSMLEALMEYSGMNVDEQEGGRKK